MSYDPALDGLRAVSIALVLAAHAGLSHVVPGGLGVSVFFAVSGYLITTLLLDEHRRTGGIRLGRFYGRRALRLVPAATAYVLVAGLVFSVLVAPVRPLASAAALLEVGNYAEIFTRLFDNGGAAVPHPFVVLWSLAIEEHFYLLLPPVLALLLRRGPDGARIAVLLLVLLAALSLGWRCHLAGLCASPDVAACGVHPDQRLYKATDTRLDAIGFGALAAVLPRPDRRRRPALIGAALLLLAVALLVRDPFFRLTVRDTLEGAAFFILVPAIAASRGPVRRALALRPLVLVGRLSYGLYLWHWLALMLATTVSPGRGPFFVPVFLGLTGSFAVLSWRLLERPCLRLRRRLGSAVPDGLLAPLPIASARLPALPAAAHVA